MHAAISYYVVFYIMIFLKNFCPILPYFLLFLLLEALIRVMLMAKEWGQMSTKPIAIIRDFVIGAAMDIATFAYVFPALIALYLLLTWHKYLRKKQFHLQVALFAAYAFILVFNLASQWLYWDELTSRYNFIAVDYLIYMDEVMGNLKQTYNLPLWIGIISIITIIIALIHKRWLAKQSFKRDCRAYYKRLSLPSLVFAILSYFTISEDFSSYNFNRYNNEIAKNGIFSLVAAFRNNELDYDEFYLTKPQDKALADLRATFPSNEPFIDASITRKIQGDHKLTTKPNIMLIVVESLSAEYMGVFGNKDQLTPYLDALTKKSLFFSNTYAAGTRTVYGLSAVNLSIPPIPGNSIVRRPNNGNLFSLANVLNTQGYNSSFLYGGYGYFDNMNTFFSGNGYHIIDRSSLADNEIHFANIWGVCDEDIFNRTIKENDASFTAGKPFFNMIMTTSNHQPFTYPDGKVAIKSGTKRQGGVQYTDYAIGNLIENARTKPWFDNTIFVIVADHTAGSSGKQELSPEHHHIPMLFYAPKLIQSQNISHMVSQIDLAPTLLGLIGLDYNSRFYGTDQLKNPKERAFIANYQNVGLLKPEMMVVLKSEKHATFYKKQQKEFVHSEHTDTKLLDEAITYFQNATHWREYNHGL